MNIPTRCITCHDTQRVGELKDMIFIEPTDAENPLPKYLRGWICEECAIIHWANEVKS